MADTQNTKEVPVEAEGAIEATEEKPTAEARSTKGDSRPASGASAALEAGEAAEAAEAAAAAAGAAAVSAAAAAVADIPPNDLGGLRPPSEGSFQQPPPPQPITAAVPRLDDLIVKCLSENYDIYPAFDRIPVEYLDNVVALLDPSQIDFTVAAKYITTEKFWRRLCQERWPICQVASHGLSWKRLYIERHLQALFEAYYPSRQNQNYDKLMKEVNAGKPFVHTVKIQQLLSHLDLSDILINFSNLSTLQLKYGARKLGMDYDKSLFGMQLKDAMSLSHFFTKTLTLNRLTLKENLLGDEAVHILCSGLIQNDTITFLDLSHNKIADAGARRISGLLERQGVLTSLDLSDNSIHEEGATALGNALSENYVLQELSVRLNPLGDIGGTSILQNLMENEAVSKLDLGSTHLKSDTGKALVNLLERNSTITTMDLSCNEVAIMGDTSLAEVIAEALSKNQSVTELDLRKNTVAVDTRDQIKSILSKRYATQKRSRRKLFQQGWDEAL